MLTVPEVAERLRVAVSTVYALVDSGRLSAYRVGPHYGAIRVSEVHLQTYLDTCESVRRVEPRNPEAN